MVHRNVLSEYTESIKTLREQCLNAGMSEEEFQKLYFDSIHSLEDAHRVERPNQKMLRTKYILFFLLTIATSCIIYNYKTIYTYVVCHVQEFIYPGLRLLRKLTIPFISLFPSLTDFYHETCLIQNPFFAVVDMDCWPCSSVNTVREIKNPKPGSQENNAPFIYETEQQVIDLDLLRNIYVKNQHIFDREPNKILVDNKYNVPLHEMFSTNMIKDNKSFIWKFNTMVVARILRQVIPRPAIVPKFGQATERFIIIDTSQKSLRIPDTECSYSFLLSLSGTRTINLIPAEECKHQCKSLKVELKETYLLWYNWWYWRPMVQSTNSNVTFIAHVGSYC